MALVAEAEAVGDLLYGQGGRQQQQLCLTDEIVCDALARTSACHLFHHIGDVLGREAHLVGVPVDGMMLMAMPLN